MDTEPQAIHWKRETSPAIGRVLMGIWGGLLLAIIGFSIFAAKIPAEKPVAAKPEKIEKIEKVEKVEPVESVEQKLPLPSFVGAKTIFVVAVKIPEQMLKDLDAAYQTGTKIQVITAEKLDVPYNVITVEANRITADAVLLNGASSGPS